MTLKLKLFLLMAGITVFSTSGVTAVALWHELQRGQELLYREGAAMAAQVAVPAGRWITGDGLAPGGRDALLPLLSRLVGHGPIQRAWAVNRAGEVLACIAPTGQGCPTGAPSEFLPPEGPILALTRLIEPVGIITGAPVLGEGGVVGAIRVEFNHEEVVGSARRRWRASGSCSGRR